MIRTCPADTMDVVLDRKREGVVDDSGDIRDIETTRRNVRCNEQAGLPGLEVLQSVHAGVLGHVSVESPDAEALAPKEALDTLRFLLVKREDQDPRFLCVRLLLRNELVQVTNQAGAGGVVSRNSCNACKTTYSFSLELSKTSTTWSTRLFAVKSSLPTVTRTGSRWNDDARRRTASGHVALNMSV